MSKKALSGIQHYVTTRVTWRRVASAVLLVLSVAFLAYKARDNWDALRAYHWHLQLIYLLPSFGLFVVQLAAMTWGWQLILDRLAPPVPFIDHLRIYGYTNVMRRIPAGLLWSLAGRVYAYKDHNLTARVLALGSFFEMLLVILTGLPIAALAGAGLGFLSPGAGFILAASALALMFVAIHPLVLGKLASAVKHHELRTRLRYRDTLLWAVVYASIWIISSTGFYMVACLFGPLPAGVWPTMTGVWVLSTLFAYITLFSPSGLGVKEVSLTVLLSLFLGDPLPLLIALAIRLIWTVYDIAAGMAALLL